MKKSKRQAPTETVPVRREEFESWTAYQAALAASDDPDDFVHLLELPTTLADWIDYEKANIRRWWTAQPLTSGEAPPEYIARAEQRARDNYEATKGTTQ